MIAYTQYQAGTLPANSNQETQHIADDTSDIRIEIEDGVAYIDGVVQSEAQRHRIEAEVKAKYGVVEVVNGLMVENIATALDAHYLFDNLVD